MTNVLPTLLPGRRLRLVRQSEVAECGLASLAMILNYWGARTDLAALRRRFGLSARGVGLGDLMAFADRLGMTSRPLRIEPADLRSLSLPAILHWNLNHFVVVSRVKGSRAWIADPDGGERWHEAASLSRHMSGVALDLHLPPPSLRSTNAPR